MTTVTNLQSFEKLLGICTRYGGKYNPGRPNLRVENLSDMRNEAREKILQVSVAKTNYESAQNDREHAFADIRLLASRVYAELKSSGASPQTVADAALMVRKIKGKTGTKKPSAAASAASPESSDTSGKTVVNRARNGKRFGYITADFEKLLQTLIAEAAYQPANPELQVNTLQEKLAQLRSANAEVVSTFSAWVLSRNDRYSFFYLGSTSLHSTAMAVKEQMKATFGNKSEATKDALKVRFTKQYHR
jgi:cell pole-organizing protein PopZ